MEEPYKPVVGSPNPAPVQPKRSKRSFLVLVIFVAAVIAAFGLYRTVSKEDDISQVPKELVAGQVSITEDKFEPATIKIKKNDSITWTNNSQTPHQIASDPHPSNDTLPGLFSPNALGNSDTYTYTFEKSGTFTYHDHLNPFGLQGTVIVE